ncbi:hypothetical protein RND71_030691 [Anisodus tanguticus]|uniref:Uncharacterized protein n=1 Tax=Anisodus tanguticus TaxID=243964 RepID=A0AAE1RI18_9SOLA|nr:hypothetical protein RND71_030691 [Anisodus tanguticus]
MMKRSMSLDTNYTFGSPLAQKHPGSVEKSKWCQKFSKHSKAISTGNGEQQLIVAKLTPIQIANQPFKDKVEFTYILNKIIMKPSSVAIVTLHLSHSSRCATTLGWKLKFLKYRLMIIENGISMICDKSTCGLHHILRGCSMSHLLRVMATRDGHMDTLKVLVYPADILFVILV